MNEKSKDIYRFIVDPDEFEFYDKVSKIEIDLSTLRKAESKGRPGLVKRKVKVHRGGKVFEQYRWVKSGTEEPAEKKGAVEEPTPKPKKPLAIVGLNKPVKEDFAHKVEVGDWVNLAGRMVKVQSVDSKNEKVTLGAKGSPIPDETLTFEELNMKGTHETTEGKFKEEKTKPKPKAKKEKPAPKKTVKAKTPVEKPAKAKKVKPGKIDTKDLSKKMESYQSDLGSHPDSEDMVDSISNYTATNYIKINEYLRKGGSKEEIKLYGGGSVDDEIDSISTFLKNAPKMEGMVYRGMNFWKDEPDAKGKFAKFLNQVKEGGSLVLKPFTSTSTDEKVMSSFMATGEAHTVSLEIKSKSGVYLNGTSQMPTEHEVLFDKDSKFNVLKVDKSGYPEHVKIVMEEI